MFYIYNKDIIKFSYIFSEIDSKIKKGNNNISYFSFSSHKNVEENDDLDHDIYAEYYMVAAMIYNYVLKKDKFIYLYKYYSEKVVENYGNTGNYLILIKILDCILNLNVYDLSENITYYEDIIEEEDDNFEIDCKYYEFYTLYNYLINNYKIDNISQNKKINFKSHKIDNLDKKSNGNNKT